MTETKARTVFWFRAACSAVLFVCAALHIMWTWRWPLVGDSSLIHYICFLMDHGLAPYRDVGDMNMPGSFLIEWLAMHVYGGGSLAWRLFDLTVLAAMAAGMLAITWPRDRFAGLFAATVFMALHGRDGIFDTGQRDLIMAALVVVAYAFFFRALRRNSSAAAFLFGFCIAAAGTIKPTALPLGLLLIVLLAAVRKQRDGRGAAMVLCACAGYLLPPAIVLAFLVREHAAGAFAHTLATVVPYFASLGRRPVSFLLLHSVSPLMVLVILWVILRVVWFLSKRSGGRWDWKEIERSPRLERAALLLGALTMLAGFLAQGKGFPYQRYPFLVLLLLLISLDCTRALGERGLGLALGVAGLGYGAFVLVPQSLALIRSYDWRNQEGITMLESDLARLGGSALSGHVQCIDTISGCGTTLYRMQLLPATGLLSDFLIFGPDQKTAVREARAHFAGAMQTAPPDVVIVGSRLFPSGPDHFGKLEMWPQFRDLLASEYRLYLEQTPPHRIRWWSRDQNPASYRIYLRNACLSSDESSACRIAPDVRGPQGNVAVPDHHRHVQALPVAEGLIFGTPETPRAYDWP